MPPQVHLCAGGGGLAGWRRWGQFVRPARRCRHARSGAFTLIEVAITVLIVAILAALLAPMLTARVREAKWTEGRAGAGALATGIRTYCAETGTGHAAVPPGGSFVDFRVYEVDLTGKYFKPANYSVSPVAYNIATGSVSYIITIAAPACVGGAHRTLNQAGVWSDGR